MSAEAPAAKKLKGEDGGAVAAEPAAPAEPAAGRARRAGRARQPAEPAAPADAPEAAVEHATERELTPTEMAVQKQIEFYFSDANLRKDQFLRFQASQTHEGWVPISVLLTFKRLQALTTDPACVADVVSRSKTLLVNSEKTAIRRRNAFQLNSHDDSRERTLFIKCGQIHDAEQLQALFGSVEGVEVQLVRMRRDAVVSSSLAVCLSSTKLRLSSKLRSVQNCPLRTRSSNMLTRGVSRQTASTPRRATQRWRERADNQPFNPSDTGKRKRDDEADVKIEYTKGLILKLNTDDTTLTREDIKTEVMKYGKAAFVDFHSGSTEGYVCMQTPEMSNAVVAAMARVDVDASAPAAEAQLPSSSI